MKMRIGLLFLTAALVSCQTTNHQTKSQMEAEAKSVEQKAKDVNYVTQTEAEQRAARVSQVHYQLNVDLTQGDKNFQGAMVMQFQLSDANADLKVDLTDATISGLNANGVEVKDFTTGKRYFVLPQKYLKVGQNEIKVQYLGLYSHSGEGLHRFQDPLDKRDYLYTQFEAFDANRFMPCFDQPDLKAKLRLEVTAPKSWSVITNVMETSKKKIGSGSQQWIFPDTATMSTYLFAIHAGDFKIWKSSFQDIPLRLFARRTLAKYVDANDWFKITKQGLGFYGKYFDYKYPFKKYDQLVVPEFNAGAMENVAAVTFTESYISRGAPTRNQRASLAETILHEMAHMWFGDLVTMKWWNDLWLNESFATYMEGLSASGATEFKDAEMDTYSNEKQWAYFEDQLVTTHPIEASVKNTDESFTNFDGITYGKGASVFKQLSYTIGADAFRKGVRSYFKKYAYQNTTLADFMTQLGAASQQDLGPWSQAWLKDAGLDTLKYSYTCSDQKISSFSLGVSPPSTAKYFRTHAFEVAFLNSKTKPVVNKNLRVVMTEKTMQLADAVGLDCPSFVYPNFQDNDYIKFEIDQTTIQNLKTSYTKIENPLLRLMFAGTMWQMVRDQRMKLADYAEIAMQIAANEKDFKILRQVIATISGGRRADSNCIYYFMPTETQAQQAQRNEFVARVEKQYLQNAMNAPANSDLQKTWFDALVHATETPEGLARLVDVFKSKKSIAGLTIDQDRRWTILQQMCTFNYPQVSEIVSAEVKKDSSSRAKESSLACLAAIPTLENKKAWYAQLKAENTNYSLGQISQIARSIFPYQQRELQKSFSEDYFNFMAKSFARDQEYLANMTRLTPTMCNESSAGRIRNFASSDASMPAIMVKSLKIAGQEDERCAKIHAFNSH